MIRKFRVVVASIPAPLVLSFIKLLKIGERPPFTLSHRVRLACTSRINLIKDVGCHIHFTFFYCGAKIHIHVEDFGVVAHVVAPVVGPVPILEEHKTLFEEGDIGEDEVEPGLECVVF